MPQVLTVLRVDVDPGQLAAARAALERSPGIVAEPEPVAPVAGGRAALVAAFHLAADAVAAALGVTGGPGGAPAAGVTLGTGEVVAAGAPYGGPARARVDAVAAHAGSGRIVLTGSTAVMVSPVLPPGTELVDLGAVTLGDHLGERAFELRPAAGEAGRADDDAAASNLGWARRAAAHAVVGRDGPLARLEAAWAATVEGDRRVVVLSGDPGIGKTTLAAELALRVHARGATVLYGRWDDEAHAPYQAVTEALGTYAGACPRRLLRQDLAAGADDLTRLLPDLGTRLGGVRPPLADDPDAERLRLFDAVGRWIGAIARRRPALLVLDDLQWAPPSSLLLLRHLREAPPGGPLLIVVTLRGGEGERAGPRRLLDALGDDGSVDRVELPGLTAGDVTEIVALALGRPLAGGDEAAAARWLAEETAGNPLFVHEILRGLDPADPGGALLEARRGRPERLHDAVRWRLARLAPETAEALAAAALVGEEFAVDVVVAAVGGPEPGVRRRLDEAVRAGMVRVADGDHRLAFTHAVVRRALQDGVAPDRAAGLHRRIGDALARGAGDAAAAREIAHHYLRAVDLQPTGVATAPAIEWGRAAADQARRETAYEAAVQYLARVVAVHDRLRAHGPAGARTGELACELRLELADAHDRAGEFTARDERYLEAAALARASDRSDLLARAALGYGGRLPAAPPRDPVARRLLDETLARLPPADSRARALALARLAQVLHADAPHAERKAIADEAEAMARRLDAPVVLASVLVSRVLALDGPDDMDDHLDIGAEVIAIGRRTRDPDLELQGARARIHPLFVVGAHDAARDLADTFTRVAGTTRHPDHLRLAAMWGTMWAALEGRFDEAEAEADRLRARLEVAGHPQVVTISVAQTLVTRWLRGTAGALQPVIDAGLSLSPDSFTWWALGTWIAAGSGADAARERLDERPVEDLAAADAGYLWLFAVVGVAVSAASVGHARWARAAHDALAPYSGRNCVLGYAAYLGAVDHHLGALAAVLGRCEDAARHLEAALARHRAIGARPWVALTGAWLANALAARDGRGDAGRAAALRDEAAGLAAELGVAVLPPPHAGLTG